MSTGFKLIKIYRAGYCLGRGSCAEKTLGWKKVRFYTRCFLLEHPKRGLILIDTGYGTSLLEATQKGVYSLYSKILPITYKPEDSIVNQLSWDKISIKDLSYLVLTHFHPDHIGSLNEFKNVPWIYRKDVLDRLMKLSPLRGLLKGFIRPLVPTAPTCSIPIREDHFVDKWNSFASHDLFGDGSLHLIDLPGHALGQLGIVTKDHVIVADARWGSKSLPNKLGFLFQEDAQSYRKTLESLQKLSPSTEILQTHTIEAHV